MKKNQSRLLKFTILVMVMICLSSQAHAAKLSKKKVSISAGCAYMLKLKENTATVRWSSSNKSVVAVVKGDSSKVLLKAGKKGKAVISAKIGKKTLKCKITVKKAPEMPLKLTLVQGTKYKLKLSGNASWKTSNSSVIKLGKKKGKTVTIRAGKPGKAVVTAKVGKKTRKCVVTVLAKTWKSAKNQSDPNSQNQSDPSGQNQSDPNAQNQSDPSGQNQSDPNGQNQGNPNDQDPKKESTNNNGGGSDTSGNDTSPKPITGLTISNETLSLTEGEEAVLTVQILPSDTTADKTITWTSSRESVATVDASGKVLAKATGTARITATASDGKHKANCIVTVKEGLVPGTVFGFDIYSYSNSDTVKVHRSGQQSADGSAEFTAVFLTDGNERWLDENVTFEMKDVTPKAIKMVFQDLGISSANPSMQIVSGADEVAFDNTYGFTITEPFDEAGPSGSSVKPVGGKVVRITAGPATRVMKVTAKQGQKVLDHVYVTLKTETWNNDGTVEYSAYDLNLYKIVRRKVEAKLWTSGMSNLEKLSALSDYINSTCHYPNTATTQKSTNPTFWNLFSVDDCFRYYRVNDVIMNRILDFQGGEITCVASSIIERAATEDLGLRYLYDGETGKIAEGEGVYVGIGTGSSTGLPGAHETLWYISPDGKKTGLDTQGMDYPSGSSMVTCGAHQCREKIISLK